MTLASQVPSQASPRAAPRSAAQVHAVIDALYAALSAKDAARAQECFADDSVMYTLAPPLEQTPENAPGVKGVQAWLDGFWSGPFFEARERRVEVEGSTAFAFGVVRMTGRKRSGEEVDLWYRDSFGLKKRDGAWRIVHQHESVPFYMDAGQKAATDLKPETRH